MTQTEKIKKTIKTKISLAHVFFGLTVPLLLVLIAWADYLVAYRVSFALLYIIPVAVSGRLFGFLPGVFVALLAVWIGLEIDKMTITFQWFWTPYLNALLRFLAFGFILLIQNRYKVESLIARTDGLTGLLNRKAFWEIMGNEVDRCKRYRHPVSIAYLDVDDFKAVNDRYGHNTGDRFLKTLAKTIQKGSRVTDKVGRLGGDEFAILMPETDEHGAQIVLRRLSNLAHLMSEHLFSITVSIGAVTFLKPPSSVENMISEADRLMYLGKKHGKNRTESTVIR